jgi:excisionase family DNA binding protein
MRRTKLRLRNRTSPSGPYLAESTVSSTSFRRRLADDECAFLLGSLIAALVETSGVDTTRRAVTWWARTDAAWLDFCEPQQEMLLVPEVARIARCSVETVRYWIQAGKLHSTRPGRRRMVSREDLNRFLSGRNQKGK